MSDVISSDEIAEKLGPEAAAKAGAPSVKQVEVEVEIKPPPPFVKTIRQLIYWQYAKLIAKAAGPCWENNYGFITSRYKLLESGKMHMSELDKDNRKQVNRQPKCEYCGASGEPLTEDHLIPMVKLAHDSADNIVLACRECNSSKGDRDVFDWYYNVRKEKEIPKMVWSKYLKLAYGFHAAFRTLDKTDINHDGRLDIMDLGAIFRKYDR